MSALAETNIDTSNTSLLEDATKTGTNIMLQFQMYFKFSSGDNMIERDESLVTWTSHLLNNFNAI